MTLPRKKIFYIYAFFACLFLATLYVVRYLPENEGPILSPPSLGHWFGTDVIGDDIFIKCVNSIFTVLITMAIVLPTMHFGGLVLGVSLSYFENPKYKELILNFMHYWATLPVLLLALFLLILFGAGQQNVIIVMIFALLPSQSLYAYSQLEEAKKQEFVIAKKSCGFKPVFIMTNHLLPYMRKSYTSYSLSRLPEILMMDLAFNFIGLGAQMPQSSFGQMFFEGLQFMFSAWWLWIFPAIIMTSFFVFPRIVLRQEICVNGG